MREHGATGDVSVPEVEVFEDTEVAGFDREKKLFLEGLRYGGVQGELREIVCELAICFGDLRGGGVGGMDGRIARVGGHGEGLAGAVDVSSRWHDHGEMAICASSARGVDGAGVRVELLLEELERGVGGRAGDLG